MLDNIKFSGIVEPVERGYLNKTTITDPSVVNSGMKMPDVNCDGFIEGFLIPRKFISRVNYIGVFSLVAQSQHTEAVNGLGIGYGVGDKVDTLRSHWWWFSTALDEVGVKRDSTPYKPETQCVAVEKALTCERQTRRAITGLSDDQRVRELSNGSGKGQNQQTGYCVVGGMGQTDNGYFKKCSKLANLFLLNKGACYGEITEAVS